MIHQKPTTKSLIDCYDCNGLGWIEVDYPVYASASNPYGYYSSEPETCPTCLGDGTIEVDPLACEE